MVSRKAFWLAPLALVLVLLGLALFLKPKGRAFYGTRLINPKPVDFNLESPQGPVRLAELSRGRVVLVFFGFTRCPDVCPTTLLHLKRVYESLTPKEQERVRVVFVSVDPKRDTPEEADRYAKAFHPSFLGVTGTPEAIKEVAQRFGVYYDYRYVGSSQDYLVDHTATTFVVRNGELLLLYSPDRIGATEKVVGDLRAL